ncbi:MAG: ATP-binding protein, partial [Gammaproteobacteria bacterium]
GGDLEQAVEIQGRDEIAFLARSFNDMTRALLAANDEAERGRARLQAQGAYLETVLGSLSAGVLTLDSDGRVQRLNRAGERILGLAPSQALDLPLTELAEREPELAPLVDTVAGRLERARWQREVPLQRHGASLVLLARGSALSGADGSTGHVVVFDDVTVLDQAQRDAAWAEAARRMAHEVKNPLTPIRLAAERLRMKLTDKLGDGDAEILDRSATTIVAQVEALRRMVDAFGDYARERERMRESVALDELVRQVTDLYRQGNPKLEFELDLCDGPAGLMADGGQLRQLLHNLIRNALEASASGAPARIRIRSRVLETDADGQGRELELVIRDDGPGFPVGVLAQPFEPYVTHKPGGSGLGLAICRKIVVDHDGAIEIDNPAGGGARTRIRLPLAAATAPPQDAPAPGERSAGGS